MKFNISLALALETLIPSAEPIDITREVPESPVTLKSTGKPLYINHMTLARQIVSANPNLSPAEVSGYMEMEFNRLKEYFKSAAELEPVLYKPNYLNFLTKSRLTKRVRPTKTDTKTGKESARIAKAAGIFERTVQEVQPIPEGEGVIIIHTHILLDMLIYKDMYTPLLLEGNTGRVRDLSSMYERFARVGKDKVPPLPFTPLIYGAFGDKHITPLPIKLRRELLEIRNSAKWTPRTPQRRILSDLKIRDISSGLRYYIDTF